MNPRHCLIVRIYIDCFCSGRAKSRCEGVLVVDFDEFYHQHSFGFHTFRTILLWFSLTLTSSMSFGEYLNSGTTCMKMSRNGEIPRPAGLGQAGRPTPVKFHRVALWNMTLSTWSSLPKGASGKIHKLRSKGLNQVKLGPIPMTTQRFRTQTNLRSNVDPVSNMPEGRRPVPSQSQADRPRWSRQVSNYLRWSQATTSDFRSESGASTRRLWEIGGNSRPTGPTCLPLVLSLGVEVKHNRLTCVQLTPSFVPTLK